MKYQNPPSEELLVKTLYTLHLPTPEARAAARARIIVPVQDEGETSLSFRAMNDRTAAVSAAVAAGDLPDWYVTTGLGLHRRTVTV